MPHSMGSGTISFGLVSIPVKMFSATNSSASVSFNLIHESCGSRIKQQIWCPKHERVVERTELVKGFEFAKDQYVQFTPDELKAIEQETSKMIDIEEFVPLDEVDPIYFESTYYLAPAGAGAAKAYGLLLKGMEATSKIAIGRFVMRTKEYLCAIRPYDGVLALNTMLFPDEVVSKKDVPELPDRKVSVGDKELKIATSLIESLSTSFKPSAYKDTYREQVLKMIDQKAKGKEIVAPEEPEEQAEIVDLLAALEASVEAAKKAKAGKKPAAKKAPAKKRAKKAA